MFPAGVFPAAMLVAMITLVAQLFFGTAPASAKQYDVSAYAIDWNPVGSDWEVPLRNIDVTITLPQAVESISALPAEDLVAPPATQVAESVQEADPSQRAESPQPAGSPPGAERVQKVHFHRNALPPRTHYHVVVSFPEIIPIVTVPPPPVAQWVVIGLVLGALMIVLDIRSHQETKLKPAVTGPGAADLSLLETAVLLYTVDEYRRRGIVATVFALAQAGTIKLRIEPKRNPFGSDKVHVDVADRGNRAGGQRTDGHGSNEVERVLLDALRRRKTLQKFAQESSTLRKIVRTTEQQLKDRGLISEEQQRKQMSYALTGLLFGLFAVAGFIVYGFNTEHPVLLAPAILFALVAIGRFIRAGLTTRLSPQGLHAREDIRTLLDGKMERIDDLMRYEMTDAWNELFAELPHVVLHEKFTAGKISRMQCQFRRMDRVRPPDWIGYDEANVGKTFDALTAAEVVNYTFIAMMATAQSTGASGVGGVGGGAGAPGAGAGGGGGGAG